MQNFFFRNRHVVGAWPFLNFLWSIDMALISGCPVLAILVKAVMSLLFVVVILSWLAWLFCHEAVLKWCYLITVRSSQSCRVRQTVTTIMTVLSCRACSSQAVLSSLVYHNCLLSWLSCYCFPHRIVVKFLFFLFWAVQPATTAKYYPFLAVMSWLSFPDVSVTVFWPCLSSHGWSLVAGLSWLHCSDHPVLSCGWLCYNRGFVITVMSELLVSFFCHGCSDTSVTVTSFLYLLFFHIARKGSSSNVVQNITA